MVGCPMGTELPHNLGGRVRTSDRCWANNGKTQTGTWVSDRRSPFKEARQGTPVFEVLRRMLRPGAAGPAVIFHQTKCQNIGVGDSKCDAMRCGGMG